MSAAPKDYADDLPFDDEAEERDGEEETSDEDVMTVTLEELEVVDPKGPRSARRRSGIRRLAPRASERRSRSTRPTARRDPPFEAAAPATESLARLMGALILAAAIFVVLNATL
jgi:hypothetical protein